MIPTVLPAYKYLTETRKLSEETIRTFTLGHVSQEGFVYLPAEFSSTLPEEMKKPHFNNSSLFPIFDLYGDCIAVSARPLGPTKTKYINTVYKKSDHLYGLSVTWPECLKEQSVYVVEGNVSLLQMYQAGIKNCVAMLGSELSTTQVCLLSRFVKKIVLVPDADTKGALFLEKMGKLLPKKLYDADVKFTFVCLPDGKDPDDFFREKTKQDFLSIPEEELA